jgi:hypothetical protein
MHEGPEKNRQSVGPGGILFFPRSERIPDSTFLSSSQLSSCYFPIND